MGGAVGGMPSARDWVFKPKSLWDILLSNYKCKLTALQLCHKRICFTSEVLPLTDKCQAGWLGYSVSTQVGKTKAGAMQAARAHQWLSVLPWLTSFSHRYSSKKKEGKEERRKGRREGWREENLRIGAILIECWKYSRKSSFELRVGLKTSSVIKLRSLETRKKWHSQHPSIELIYDLMPSP